ncbi:hypothetical protein ACEWY4_004331 [Coilia grayii]|uniref:Coiled-coil domain-containing protein 106 n=1 Tax=Coilia grayii TaxID=363190 RepID=A0ABD1KL89_9TELE
MRPKRRKTQAAITLEDEAEDLTPGEAQTQEDAPTAQAKLMKLQEEICALKEERDFLREQLKAALQRPNAGPSSGLSPAPETRQPDTSDSDSSKSSPTTCSSSSSSDMRGKKTRKRKKKRHNKTKPKKCVKFGKRMKTSEDVVNRYRAVLRTYKKTRSLRSSCEYHDVDRNTIALTAVIAEMFLAADEEKGRIPKFTGPKLMQYANECKAFLDTEPQLKERIQKMKQNGELLPVSYKTIP